MKNGLRDGQSINCQLCAASKAETLELIVHAQVGIYIILSTSVPHCLWREEKEALLGYQIFELNTSQVFKNTQVDWSSYKYRTIWTILLFPIVFRNNSVFFIKLSTAFMQSAQCLGITHD